MHLGDDVAHIVNSVLYCSHCQPLSGCIISDLKGKKKADLQKDLSRMSKKTLERILSYHSTCPYRNRLAI